MEPNLLKLLSLKVLLSQSVMSDFYQAVFKFLTYQPLQVSMHMP